jgi:hypothetical protein
MCVGRAGLDIINIIISSQIAIVIIIISPRSPAEECREEMCEGGRGHDGNHFSFKTEPLPWWGMVSRASKERIFISSSSIISMFGAVILQQQCQLPKKQQLAIVSARAIE